MPIVFPGMDPYLENPAIFPGIHGPMVIYIRDQISAQIRPRYIASVGERVYVESSWDKPPGHAVIPDVWIRKTTSTVGEQSARAVAEMDEPLVLEAPDLEIRQPFLEILDRESNLCVVTVIELVSPSNKYAGPGRDSYEVKQWEVLYSDRHLVEVDLLRRGPHVLAVNEALVAGRCDYDYLVSVHRAHARAYEVYPRTVRQPLPRIRIPLAGDDPDVRLDLRTALAQAYDAGSYHQRIDYSQPCQPPLSTEDQAWADELLRAAESGATEP